MKYKLLYSSNTCTLYKIKRQTGSTKYIIKIKGWNKNYFQLEQLFDPFRNRSTSSPYSWKFNTQEEAEHLLSIARLKGWV